MIEELLTFALYKEHAITEKTRKKYTITLPKSHFNHTSVSTNPTSPHTFIFFT